MALTFVTPMLAQNMMACTQPVIFSPERETSDSAMDTLPTYSFPRIETVSVPLTQFIVERYCEFPCEKHPISPPKSVRHMKVGAMNRRNHNIHQPGRTNCNQRFQKM